jgi:ATP-dependent exoDNAse (exonuclease V) beta subunit
VALARAAKFLELPDDAPQTEQAAASARAILQGFMTSAVFKNIAGAKIIGREIPFLYPLAQKREEDPTAMRGVIDLLYESGGELVVADYKTTRVEAGEGKETAKHYQRQGAAYQEAVRRALGRPARFDVIFLRTGEQVTFPQSA